MRFLALLELLVNQYAGTLVFVPSQGRSALMLVDPGIPERIGCTP